MVPGVSNSTGRAGHMATELRVHNRDSQAAAITIRFVPADGSGAPEPFIVTVPTGQTTTYRNVLRDLWSLEDQSGNLEIDSDSALLIRAYKFTDQREDKTGVTLPTIAASGFTVAGAKADILWLDQSGDAATGSRSSVWVQLGSEATAADLVVLDAAGAELGRVSVTGAPRSRMIQIADIVPEGGSPARAELLVTQASAAAYSELNAGQRLDMMGMEATALTDQANDITYYPLLREAMPDGSWLVTDIRLVNPWSSAGSAYVYYGTKFIELKLKETRDFPDFLQSVWNVTGEASTPMRIIFSPKTLYAVMRTASVSAAGELLAGEIHSGQFAWEVFNSETPFTLAGIPREASDVTLYSRTERDGASATAQAEDENGAPAGPPSALDLPSGQVLELKLAALPGVVTVTPTAGAIRSAALSVMPGSGDPAWHGPVVPVNESCSGPAIISFYSSMPTLPAAGAVNLSWNVVGADQIEISAAGLSVLPAIGTAPVNVSGPSNFILFASNPCGSQTAAVQVAVGAPVLSFADLAVPSAKASGGGSPGQLMKLSFDNLTQPENVESLVFRDSTGAEAVTLVLATDRKSTIYALVPYFAATGSGPQYRTGNFQVSALTTDGKRTNGAPFRIDPLV